MAPEYGATCGFFPVDKLTLDYLHETGRDEHRIRLTEEYLRAQGMFRTAETPEPVFTDILELDLATVVPSISGPKRPQDRVVLTAAKTEFEKELTSSLGIPANDANKKHLLQELTMKLARVISLLRLSPRAPTHQTRQY